MPGGSPSAFGRTARGPSGSGPRGSTERSPRAEGSVSSLVGAWSSEQLAGTQRAGARGHRSGLRRAVGCAGARLARPQHFLPPLPRVCRRPSAAEGSFSPGPGLGSLCPARPASDEPLARVQVLPRPRSSRRVRGSRPGSLGAGVQETPGPAPREPLV